MRNVERGMPNAEETMAIVFGIRHCNNATLPAFRFPSIIEVEQTGPFQVRHERTHFRCQHG